MRRPYKHNTQYDIFLSHNGDDKADVEALARRLREEGLSPFLDKWHLVPGEPWQEALEEALDASRTVAVFLGPSGISPWENEEMRSALEEGVRDRSRRVIPVLLPGAPEPRDRPLPRFLRRRTWVDFRAGLDDEDAFRRLLSGIRGQPPGPSNALRVDAAPDADESVRPPPHPRCMAPPPPPDFVPRPVEYEALIAYLCADGGSPVAITTGAVAITTALRGAGGYGKTTLAQALCHDERLWAAYPDGILWATLGESPNVYNELVKVYAALTGVPTREVAFVDVDDAARALAEALEGRRCLLVIDDVWNAAHLQPFLQGTGHGAYACLITTRYRSALPAGTQSVDVDAMQEEEADKLLVGRVTSTDPGSVRRLAARLGEWPLLLKLANGALRAKVERGLSSSAALVELEAELEEVGLTAFDASDPAARDQAVALTVEVSLRPLSEPERTRYRELVIYPEDTEVPLAAVERLWGATGGLGLVAVRRLCERLYDLSLLLAYDANRHATIRLHDVMLVYLLRTHESQARQAVPDRIEEQRQARLVRVRRLLSTKLTLEELGVLCFDLGLHLDDLPGQTRPGKAMGLVHVLDQGDRLLDLLEVGRQLRPDIAWERAVALAEEEPREEVLTPLQFLHRQFLDAYGVDRWPDLPAEEPYLWRHLAYHLREAAREDKLRTLLFDFDWMWAKLHATDVNALLADYDAALAPPQSPPQGRGGGRTPSPMVPTVFGRHTREGWRGGLRLIQGAIRLSTHILSRDKDQLPAQVYGRLLPLHEPEIVALQEQLEGWRSAPWLRPLAPCLEPPGGALLRTMSGHSSGVGSVAVTSDGRRAVSASDDRTLKVWDLESGDEIRTLKGHSARVTSVAVTPDGRRAVSASDDHTLVVWDVESGEELRRLEGHRAGVRTVAVTPDGRRAVSASDDRTLKVWDLENGGALRTLEGHRTVVWSLAVTSDGQCAVSASDDLTLKVWDLQSGEALRTLEGHSAGVSSVAVMPDGRRAVSASYDRTLVVWDLESGDKMHTLEGHSDAVRAVVAAAQDGTRVVSASNDYTLKVWDLESIDEIRALQSHSDTVNAVAVTSDGRRAISASDDYTLKVWDLDSGRELRTLEGHVDEVNVVAVIPNEQRAVSASSDGTLKVWDLERGRELRTLEGHSAWVLSVAVTPDGQRAISASSDRTLKVWDLDGGLELRTLEGHSDGVLSVAATPDGQRAVSASYDGTLKVWDLERGRELQTLEGHGAGVLSVVVTPDGRRAVSASSDRTLRVWDLDSGRELRTLEGHGDGVWSVAVTPDGQCAISASSNRTLVVWHLQSGELLVTFGGSDQSAFAACTVAPDGTIVAGDMSGQMYFLQPMGFERVGS